MIRLRFFFGAFAVVAALLAWRSVQSGRGAAGAQAQESEESEAPFAVVELFTSEGCSSCPPADALLAEILKDARKDGRRIFGVAFHVDYWNRLGWTDPYSAPAFSRRQESYAQAFKNDQVYTPQMIVNGTEEFVGSDRRRSRAAIDAALKHRGRVQVKLQQEKPKAPSSLALAYAVTRAERGAVLNVAVVEHNLISEVKRGENRGRTLHHDNVVRAFQTVRLDADGKGNLQLVLPADLVRSQALVIAYVQDADRRGVVGVSSLSPAPDTTAGERE